MLALQCAWLVIVHQLSQFVTRPAVAALRGSHEQVLVNLVQTGASIVTSVVGYALLRSGLGVLAIPLANAVFFWISAGIFAIAVRRRCPWSRSRDPISTSIGSEQQTLRGLLRFGFLSTVHGAGWTVEATSDQIILITVRGSSEAGLFLLWWRLPSKAFDLCVRLADSAFPSFAAHSAVSADRSRHSLRTVGLLSLGMAAAVALGLSWLLPTLMAVWIGDRALIADPYGVAALMSILVGPRIVG